MNKYYVADMIVIDEFESTSLPDIAIKIERIIVEKTIFGYQEILTKHKLLINQGAITKNKKFNKEKLPWTIENKNLLYYLKKEKMFFLLKPNSIRLANKDDVKNYLKSFDNSYLKKFHRMRKEEKIKRKNKKIKKKQNNEEIKKLIKEFKRNLN